MLDHKGSRTFSSASTHACDDDCMLSSDDDECKKTSHLLKQHPRSVYDEGYVDILLAPSPAVTSDRSTSYSPRPPSPIENFPSIPTRNGHQRSWTSTFKLPPLVAQTASRASLHSPTKTLSNWISSQSLSQEGGASSPSKQRANPLSDWFVGTSAPVQFGIVSPTRRDSQSPTRTPEGHLASPSSEMGDSYTSRPSRMRRSSTATSSPSSAGLTSKLWGLTKSIATTATTPATRSSQTDPEDPSDELLHLDIAHALLPHGTPDILAPSSFHDLLTASTSLLSRYQSAYRAQRCQMTEVHLERSAQADELEESETRARHLKMQLDGMAEKLRQQEEVARQLSLELLAERRRREDEDAARRRSVQVVRTRSGATKEQQQRRRGTAGSHNSAASVSDSGFESDAESSAMDGGSVASGAESVRSNPAHIDDREASGYEYASPGRGGTRGRPLTARRLSTYEKVLKTTAGEPASTWAVMEGYREENRTLRDRVVELEGAVDAALDLVAGLGMVH